MDRILIKYPTPEDYVKRFALKALRTDKIFAIGRIKVNSNGEDNGPLPPHRINEDLSVEAKHFRADEDIFALDRFLHPRDMTEVIKALEREGVREIITGKKRIKSMFGLDCLRWGDDGGRTGGRPSVSNVTKYFARVRKVMEKQKAQDLLRKRLLELPITLRFERFMLKVFFILMRSNEEYVEKLLWLVAPSQDLSRIAQSRPVRSSLIQSLNSLRGDQVEICLDQLAKWSVETRPYNMHWVFSLIRYGEE